MEAIGHLFQADTVRYWSCLHLGWRPSRHDAPGLVYAGLVAVSEHGVERVALRRERPHHLPASKIVREPPGQAQQARGLEQVEAEAHGLGWRNIAPLPRHHVVQAQSVDDEVGLQG